MIRCACPENMRPFSVNVEGTLVFFAANGLFRETRTAPNGLRLDDENEL